MQIMELLGVKGPEMKRWTEAVEDYQLAHPEATAEDGESFLVAKHAAQTAS